MATRKNNHLGPLEKRIRERGRRGHHLIVEVEPLGAIVERLTREADEKSKAAEQSNRT